MYLVSDGKSAYATLPTQQKSTLLPRVPTHAYTDCEIAGRQPTRLYKEFPRIHNAGHSKKNDAQLSSTFSCSPFTCMHTFAETSSDFQEVQYLC